MYWVTGILGVASVIAPFFFGYTNNTPALWASIVIGAALVVVSGLEALAQDRENWEYWAAGLFGLAAIVSPFVLGFSTHTTAMWTVIVVGALAVVAAGWRLLTRAST